ncbi:unnamed protein product [Cuscuta epithymum]|uniref:FAS1 domain-containing protein n=1 Tax=Cuscuta epithymum TaxID=186058 RepID=A0AAV0CDS4_9ASTE|nr:unnamed protein product [Cuscuta epithymum]CAH9148931.1 unnamed protein product [Cuscuta epithymum]
MATTVSESNFASVPLLLCFLAFSASHFPVLCINVTNLLSSYPDFSDFANLITTTAVAADLSGRTSITLLAVPNTILRNSDLLNPPNSSPSSIYAGDVIRYHILLEYLSLSDLRRNPPGVRTVTTLFQATGRASGIFGSVNITRNPDSGAVTVVSPVSNATVLSQIKAVPYNVSIFSVNSLLVPDGFDLMTSDGRPPPGLNITKALIDADDFNVVASMLIASGVEGEFERHEGGAGLTLFMPTDQAFSDLPASVRFQSLPAEEKADILRFHVLTSYYPLGSLEGIVNPIEPTLLTEQKGAERFTLNISRLNGSVAIDTGVVQALVIRTVIDQNPVAIFGVSKVLLPGELFPKSPIQVEKPGGGGSAVLGSVAEVPEVSVSPENPPGLYVPTSDLTSPSGFVKNLSSAASRQRSSQEIIGFLVCSVSPTIVWIIITLCIYHW